ncbi:MAG: sensor histidine kinase [Rhodanobacteraceae bacterium]|nr:sensor histidine kinase [Rhodanobacteraceae bacterium]
MQTSRIDARFVLRVISVAAMLVGALPIVLAQGESVWSGWFYRITGLLLITATCTSFWFLTRAAGKHVHPVLASALVGVQLVTGLVVAVELLFVIVFELPLVMTRRRAGLWFALLCAVVLAVYVAYLPLEAPDYHRLLADPATRAQLIDMSSTLVFLTFAFSAGLLLASEGELRAELTATQHQLSENARLQERQELSRELHDSLGHHLTALRTQLDLALRHSDQAQNEWLANALVSVKRSLAELRCVVDARRPQDRLALHEQLHNLVGSIVKPTVVIVLADAFPALSGTVEMTLFRIAQESLTNAIKHADATTLNINLDHDKATVRLRIADNGRGCESPKWGMGLTGMRERAELCGGQLTICSNPGQGFTVLASIPLGGR